jgi:hypothetical protein
VAVAYAYFLKSAAQRLGPTLAITWPLGVDADKSIFSWRLWWMVMLAFL